MVINRIGAFSLARLAGTLYAILGLFVGAILSLAALAGAFGAGDSGGFAGTLVGIGSIVLLPIVYGVLGFIVSFIGAMLYNVLARTVGGIELDVT